MSNQVQSPRRVDPEKARGGRWVLIGDEEYRIPPLAFAGIADLMDDVEALRNMGPRPSPEQMVTVAKIVHAGIRRNYPSMTLDDVNDMLDFSNYDAILSAVLNISGFQKTAVPPSGEVPASTGTGSMSS